MTSLVEDLLRPSAFPHDVDRVELLQTHISLIFFAGKRVYKVKKPVDLGFLDYSTLAARKHFCEEEVRLNRRLAPDVYLGVAPITREDGGPHRLRGDGEVVEWAVEMERLPAHRMLSELLAKGEIDNARMNALADLLADFHGAAATGAGVDEHGAPERVAANAAENFEQLEPLLGGEGSGRPLIPRGAFEALRRRHADWPAEHRALLERRVADHRVRDGHGDLHAGNICLTDRGIVIYDCIEFSERFRCGDVAADLAFLTMDLDQRGFPAFSRYLAHRYAERTQDPDLSEVERFYKGYRAVVRGKVAAIGASQARRGSARRAELEREAMQYLQLAQGYELPPALVLLCGLPASGKSWLAHRLARPLRAAVLRSDVRRRTLSPSTIPAEAGGYGTGRYSPREKERTYEALLEAALEHLREGQTVVVDATFSRAAYRAPFRRAAEREGLPWLLVQVRASEAVTRERLAARERDAHEASEADLSVYLHAREAFEEPGELPAARRLLVPGEGPAEERLQEVLERLLLGATP